MPVAKEQIRQIIADNNLNSVADVYTLLRHLKVKTVSIFLWRQCDNSILIQNIAYVLLKQPDILPKAHRCQKYNGQYHIS